MCASIGRQEEEGRGGGELGRAEEERRQERKSSA